eukprot:gene5654-6839_t
MSLQALVVRSLHLVPRLWGLYLVVSSWSADTFGVKTPVAGVMLAVGGYLIVSSREVTASECVSSEARHNYVYDMETKVWTALTWDATNSGCQTCDLTQGDICYRDLSYTNYAVVGNVVYVLRVSTSGDSYGMYKLDTSGGDVSSWAWVVDNAAVNCCSEISNSDTTHSFNYRLAAAGTSIYIFTETRVHIYNTAASTVSSAVQCAASVCGLIALSSTAFDSSQQREEPYPLTAEYEMTSDGSKNWAFYAWPYKIVSPFSAIENPTSGEQEVNNPGAARESSASEQLQPLWHGLAYANNLVYLLRCGTNTDVATAPQLFLYDTGSYTWTQFQDAPVAACAATSTSATGFSNLISDGSAVYTTASDSSSCYLLSYVPYTWTSIALSASACCPGRGHAMDIDAGFAYGGYGSSSSSDCSYTGAHTAARPLRTLPL